ncbi:MAG: hypothetical protein M0026_03875 [Nocardiopsaceae bacterium]|nr:hypothetical protein [Nocardiopsaceae bacterium]
MTAIVDRQALWLVLLASVAVAHLLCSAGHPAGPTELPREASSAHAEVRQQTAEADAIPAAVSSHFVSEHHAGDNTAGSTADQRTPAAKMWLLLFATALPFTAVLRYPPPDRDPRPHGTRRTRWRRAARLRQGFGVPVGQSAAHPVDGYDRKEHQHQDEQGPRECGRLPAGAN